MIPKLNDYKTKWQLESADIIKPGLAAVTKALRLLENPHNHLQVVHFAGTNGKGSTLTFLEHIARKHGLTVGKFMSPCIVDVHDQIQVNGQPITEKEMDLIFKEMKEVGLSGCLTDFELLTCAAFLYFRKSEVELVLLETGMGGREDSTNVVTPIVSVIPSIALEHTKFLGPTIESIAMHKAGIIKKNRPIIIGRLPKEAYEVVETEASKQNAPLFVLGEDFNVESKKIEDTYTNKEKGIQIHHLIRSLPGRHQADNMALAISAFLEVAQHFELAVDFEQIRNGVNCAQLPGRFEQVLPNVYFDGAHNPASAKMLVETISEQFPNEPIRFVIGMLSDKEVSQVLAMLETISDEFYFVDFSNERAMKTEQMMNLSKAKKKEILKDAISYIKTSVGYEGKTIVTGSLYLLAELREKIVNKQF